jgi:hypothetical protein
MRSTSIGARRVVITSIVVAALALPAAANAALPRLATGQATHVLPTSALLNGVVNPNGQETSYYFRYGPTFAFGSQTPTVNVGSGTVKIKVGQPITGLTPGATYHFKIIAVTGGPTPRVVEGHEHTFIAKGIPLAFNLPRTMQDTFGSPFFLRGSLTGVGSANHRISLQASPYPFLEPFSDIGLPGGTNGTGAFSFRVANLVGATQFRVVTLDPRPVYSRVVTVNVAVRVTLHVRSSGRPGFVRFYGTITPAAPGAHVLVQVQKAVRPGKAEITTRYVTQFTTVTKKGGASSSRFSIIATIRHGGRYRVYVRVPHGPLTSGPSLTSIIVHAAKKG